MARTTKTLSTPRPATRVAGTRPRVSLRARKVSPRRNGDRRADTVEGRRAAPAPAAERTNGGKKRAAEPATLAAPPEPITLKLTEEEQIESAKYLPRDAPKRVFEEERFLFPESYGIDRVRLLVKDPEWLFAYWDLSPRSVEVLRRELGERGMALTRLTLRITDPGHGGTSVILLPYGARAWYVRADTATRSYRAQLGWTLPSGQFRPLADSNLVTTPRTGPSPERAHRRLRYDAPPEQIAGALRAPADAHPGPWRTQPIVAEDQGRGRKRSRGGASDTFRR